MIWSSFGPFVWLLGFLFGTRPCWESVYSVNRSRAVVRVGLPAKNSALPRASGRRVYGHPDYAGNSHPGKTRAASWFLYFLGRYVGGLLYRVRVQGLEHLPPSGPVLVLAKHQRNEDTPMGYAWVLTRRRLDNWCIMKHELVAPHYLGFCLKCGGIPINRERPMRSRPHLRLARRVLHDGRLLVIYPEQTFFENEVGPGRLPGFRCLVKKNEIPIQVLCLGYEYRRAPGSLRTTLFLRLSPARDYSWPEDPARFLHERMQELARLSGLSYEHPPVLRSRASQKS
ncbi:MAG: 1-acyl-sn-glycerol-3-phosphate acyltransferase [Spirochaetales bacterium]|nr:1-acyl-sn-glycerol-3-phosphate acyltransferase [Leptospiraceae bacterium]MCP5481638.1 1-acyl-sn-glycerol-3-phosphate acyltransferase [Spirochaetales bacterium]MCP5484466.1 1-acyl-sn-glycerol-3-phosphate acyltransferase [Spirochaetales bacterium]